MRSAPSTTSSSPRTTLTYAGIGSTRPAIHWLAAVQDPRNDAEYNYGFSYTLPTTSFFQARAGMNFGIWQLAAFCDNLFDSHTVTNYALGQTDGTVTPQQNAYTFRPRTAGLTFTLRTH